MKTGNNIRKVMKEYRILLTCLRTEKLRNHFLNVISEQSHLKSVHPELVDNGPFTHIEWLNNSYGDSLEVLSSDISTINQFLGEYSVLYTARIDELPTAWEEKKQIVRMMCERVFQAKTAKRNWLSEVEFTAKLSMLTSDAITIRRYSVDMGIVVRDERGERYWLAH